MAILQGIPFRIFVIFAMFPTQNAPGLVGDCGEGIHEYLP